MRYALNISYDGKGLSGWQRQENALSVQQILEDKMALKLRVPIQLTGCGRTDAGVHAEGYVAHFDFEGALPSDFLYALNLLLPVQISLNRVEPVRPDFHARFDAISRKYTYHIHSRKNPFLSPFSFYFPAIQQADYAVMQEVAKGLMHYDAFFPFCKSGSDAKTMQCRITESFWVFDPESGTFRFEIRSDRFLRGMVRLIVGTCLLTGLGKMTSEEVHLALEKQQPLPRPWSVPPDGLFLSDIQYA